MDITNILTLHDEAPSQFHVQVRTVQLCSGERGSAADHQRTDGPEHAAGRPQRRRVHHVPDAEASGDDGVEGRAGQSA